jgi:outer membrane protein OmpA-like peptidoglycan-associated protein
MVYCFFNNSINPIIFVLQFMTKLFFLLLLSLCSFKIVAQSENISDCYGAINILNPGTYNLQFTGNAGEFSDIVKYPSLASHQETNSLWCSFVAPFNGRLSLNAKVSNKLVKMIIFANETKDICNDISKGIAEIKRMIVKPTQQEIGLSLNYDDNFYYPMELMAGEQIMILFLFDGKEKEKLDLNLKYEQIKDDAEETSVESKIVDQRIDIKKPSFKIMIRDVETGNPVIADVLISGLKSISSFYQGSDLFFNIERSGKIALRVDAQGYFFTDREEPVGANTEHELVVWLEPIGEGKSVQLDEIEFIPGTSEFLPSSESKLKRLKEFLALNAGIKIEIQGHVQEKGENSHAGQKISEARAKKVMNYLIENGIDKKRLTAKGYGNTMPIYPDPKFAYEEQANRRVEIKIL